MSCPLSGPEPGSRAYHALKKLDSIGGGASLAQWMLAAGWTSTVNSFHMAVVNPLLVRHKVFVRDATYYISDDGMVHLGLDPEAPRAPLPAIVGPRYVAPNRPLATRNMVRLRDVRDIREGAFDYLSIPSRMGPHTVSHKHSLAVPCGDVKE
jgi:hypothetical protein